MEKAGRTTASKGGDTFGTTRWTVVLNAKDGDATRAMRALAALCQTDWYPVYAFALRRGRSPQDAEDLAQSFFARFIDAPLQSVDRSKGKFRTFLKVAVRNFMAKCPTGYRVPNHAPNFTRRLGVVACQHRRELFLRFSSEVGEARLRVALLRTIAVLQWLGRRDRAGHRLACGADGIPKGAPAHLSRRTRSGCRWG